MNIAIGDNNGDNGGEMGVSASKISCLVKDLPCLSLTYHKPYEVMLVCRPGALKKAPKLCDINLISGSLPI